jgi:hypothetical protein
MRLNRSAISVIFFAVCGLSYVASGISTTEADKFVNQYDSFSKRVMGLLNCVSRVLMGADAVELEGEAKKAIAKSQSGPQPTDLEGCLKQAGFKTNNRFFKLLAGLKKQETPAGIEKTVEPSRAPTSKNQTR